MTDEEPKPREPVLPITGTYIGNDQISLPGRRILDLASQAAPPDAQQVEAVYVRDIKPFDFEVCPICFGSADTVEHVPPSSIGGSARHLTLTCASCNNGLGSVVEAPLALHATRTVRGPRFEGDPVQGQRRARQVTVSVQADGTPVVIVDNADDTIRDMVMNGGFTMTWSEPKQPVWRTALLKHAYLAACVFLQDIPETPHAKAIRAELAQAKVTPRQVGPTARALQVLRTSGEPPSRLAVAAANLDGSAKAMVALGTYGLVSWPMPDTAVLLHLRLAATA